MELDSGFVGTTLKDFIMDVEWRDTMNYAAAVNDDNPCYFDDARKGGIIAPPMFCEAATWRISERIWQYIEAEEFPTEVLMTQVHYSEHVEFHAPVIPGDKLKISGRIAAILPHRAGTHVVICYRAVNKKDEPVFTMNTGAMLRGVKCTGGGAGESDLPVVPDAPGVGEPVRTDPVWTAPVKVSRLAPFIYDGCAKIFFPIHTSVRFAHGVGLPDIILQGTATLAMAVRELTDREAGGDPALLKTVACNFSGMVLPGTTISINATSVVEDDAGKDVHFEVLNEEGKKAIRRGYVRIQR